jgi:uncharacterized protein (TIGR02757 family)
MMKDLQEILWKYAEKYRVAEFLEDDPIQIPHRFSSKEDIEISGFFSAIMAWGQRKSIIKSSNELLNRMDNAPFDFVLNFEKSDERVFQGFVHRTLNSEDILFILNRFQSLYKQGKSIETAFGLNPNQDTLISSKISSDYSNKTTISKEKIVELESKTDIHGKLITGTNSSQGLDSPIIYNESDSPIIYREHQVRNSISNFYDWMFEFGETRTKKHISDPRKKSACKRFNMYLRWMVREDDGLDFGIWKSIQPSELMMPLDVHVLRMTEKLEIASNIKGNWDGCEKLTGIFREIHPSDPTLFDFALFGLGVDYRRQLV